MTIIEESLNKEAGNKDFNEKRKHYEKSIFEITRKIAEENNEWNLNRIAERQRWMAKQARTIWRISQLSP